MVESVGALRQMLARGRRAGVYVFRTAFDRSLSDQSIAARIDSASQPWTTRKHEMVKRARWFTVIDDTLYVEPERSVPSDARQ